MLFSGGNSIKVSANAASASCCPLPAASGQDGGERDARPVTGHSNSQRIELQL
jgi:hypothetical protein